MDHKMTVMQDTSLLSSGSGSPKTNTCRRPNFFQRNFGNHWKIYLGLAVGFLVILCVILVTTSQKTEENPEQNPEAEGESEPEQSLLRIYGGNETTEHAYPSIVLLKRMDDPQPFHCAGTIISPDWVVTAGHCIHSLTPSNYILTAGRHNRSDTTEQQQQQRRVVEEIIRHENYTKETPTEAATNDIALLKVSQPFDLKKSEKVQAAALPSRDLWTNQDLMTVGWGTTSSGETSDVLMEIEQPIIDLKTCRNMTTNKERINAMYEAVADSVICAGGKYKISSCQGDSGGPSYQLDSKGTQIVVGVTSWGADCGIKGNPDVSTRVFSFVPWIQDNTEIE